MFGLGPQASVVVLIVGMLAFGSWNTINTKLQFDTCVPTIVDISNTTKTERQGCPPGQIMFNKPWIQNMGMFIGEAALMIVYILGNSQRRTRRARREQDAVAMNAPVDGAQQPTPLYVFAIPAFCDVFGTGLAAVSMQYLDSAIWQMLRSSIIIFSAIISVLFLKRQLQPFHWVAALIVFIGLVCVGLSTALDSADDDSGASASGDEKLFGIGLVVGAQVCSAFQMCFEELLLTGRAPMSAKKVVGMEGLWGGFFMSIMLIGMYIMPGEENGSYCSTADALNMIFGSGMLLFLFISYMASISVYNLVGITVGKKMSAVVRCLVDSCRTIVVWIVNLILFYFVDEKLGVGWQGHTWLEATGFVILVIGTLLYNEVLPSPNFLKRAPHVVGEEWRQLSTTSFDNILRRVDFSQEDVSPTLESDGVRRMTLNDQVLRNQEFGVMQPAIQ
eukprot:TRINITY_DN67178_c0_g1_i1.p1 TRINITY_DN67178_c0_g1~~TRINITY_DN67178_c0_g1_i1.p1  ORF type:complete len:446 (-),score=61.50 TRINITY_DN67178_c0_g1_i1:366-1703(-)